METLSHQELTRLLLALGVMLLAARALGELARRLRQPAVVGEITAGILLGPTVLGALTPTWNAFLFPVHGGLPAALGGLTTLSIVLFLLVAGMEVDLSTIWKQGRTAIAVSASGLVFPFAVGFLSAWFAPSLLGMHRGADALVFALFFATALSITALPVIAKILMDMDLYRSDLGMLIVAAAVFDDLVGWIVFAVILGLVGGGVSGGIPIGTTVALTLGFAALVLTLGKWLVNRVLPWIQAHTSWPGGVLGFAVSIALVCAACTSWIGIHAIFGAFLFGIALGESEHLQERTRATLEHFVSFIFAPLFFASIGLRVNFLEHFDLLLVVVVLLVGTAGKTLGCWAGARYAGVTQREAWAIGFGMNARGAMEVILGLLALEAGIIDARMFVALVVLALVTSMTSGSLMQRLLGLGRTRAIRFADFLAPRSYLSPLRSTERRGCIQELVRAVCDEKVLQAAEVEREVWQREQIESTGLANGVAVPQARLEGLGRPRVAVGLSRSGVDFDCEDGELAHLIILVLTSTDDHRAQLEILSDIGRTFRRPEMVEKVLMVDTYTQFLATLKVNPPTGPHVTRRE